MANATMKTAYGTKVLEMIIGEESRAKESRIGRQDSLLYECYLRSFEVLQETITHAQRFYKNSSICNLDNYYTNVIVFDGARGRGKTSAMLTFGKTLEGINRLERAIGAREYKSRMQELFDEPSKDLRKAVESIRGNNFVVLPPIDPTVLNKSHDLLSTFTARLYQEAQECWENEGNGQSPAGAYGGGLTASSYAIRDDFLNNIKECYTAISALKDEGGGTWSLSQLGKMGAASELSKRFHFAVHSFLKLHHADPEHSFVVLQLDDADMTFGSVYKILEDMRCFLRIPNLIVLMAADLLMVENLVRQSFLKQTDHSEYLVQELTEQYMIKYFPLRRRIALPDLNDMIHHDVQHVGLRVWTDESREEDFFAELYEEASQNALCMSTTLLRMLYRRTGILLDDTKGYYPWLLPVSQRSIGGFVGLLHQMKHVVRLEKLDKIFETGDFSTGKLLSFYYPCDILDTTIGGYLDDLRSWLSNVRQLEQYLLHDWALAALTQEEGIQFRKIARSSIWDRRIATFEALESLGVKELDFSKTGDFAKLTEALDSYKQHHGPRFGYAIRVLESLFAQEYILETLQGRFSAPDLDTSLSVERINSRGELYASFPSLKSLYSGGLVANDHLIVFCKRTGSLLRENESRLLRHLFGNGHDTGGCDLQLVIDAPLFESLYVRNEMPTIKHSLAESELNPFLSRLLRLQDVMLFLASNWDAMRNVIKYLEQQFPFNSGQMVDEREFISETISIYTHCSEELLGTMHRNVLHTVMESMTSWLGPDSGEKPMPASTDDEYKIENEDSAAAVEHEAPAETDGSPSDCGGESVASSGGISDGMQISGD